MKPLLLILTFITIPILTTPVKKNNTSIEIIKKDSTNYDPVRKIEEDHSSYTLKERFHKSPDSFEAWIRLPKNLSDNQYGGVIMGNYYSSSGYDHSVNWEVTKNGFFRLYWNQLHKSAKSEVDITFTGYDLRNDTWTHVAIVRNSFEGSFSYYVNGVLNEKIYRASSDAVCGMKMTIGVDCLGWLNNTNGDNFLKNYFRGDIRQVAVYNGPISQRKILEDMNSEYIEYSNDYDLMGSWNLDDWSKDVVVDQSGNNNYLTYTNFEKYIDYEETEEYDYSIIGVPDPQIVVRYNQSTMDLDFDWMVEASRTKNVKYITFVGDLCDDAKLDDNWNVVKRNFKKLDANNIEYGFVPGNHDYDDGGGRTRAVTKINANLPYSYYSKKSYFGGSLNEGDIVNYYNLVNIDGIDYLFMNLEFGPRDCTLDWANRICDLYPNHRIVVTTHHYLEPSGLINNANDIYAASAYGIGTGNSVNNGDQVFDKFISRHQNMFIVFSGHTSYDDIVYRTDKGIYGNTIHTILIDAQGSLIATPYGFCDVQALLKFNEAKKRIYVYWYSPLHNKYLNIQNQFEISFADEINPSVGGVEEEPIRYIDGLEFVGSNAIEQPLLKESEEE